MFAIFNVFNFKSNKKNIINSNLKRFSNQVYRNARGRFTEKSLKISQDVKMERREKIRSAVMSSLFTFSDNFC